VAQWRSCHDDAQRRLSGPGGQAASAPAISSPGERPGRGPAAPAPRRPPASRPGRRARGGRESSVAAASFRPHCQAASGRSGGWVADSHGAAAGRRRPLGAVQSTQASSPAVTVGRHRRGPGAGRPGPHSPARPGGLRPIIASAACLGRGRCHIGTVRHSEVQVRLAEAAAREPRET
jgi:hypothetical protein